MRIRSSSSLYLATSSQPLPTIEVDLGSIPEGESFSSLLGDSLGRIAESDVTATVYVYFTQSVNFHEPTNSAFIVTVGGAKFLDHIHDHLTVPGLRLRFSDYLQPSRGTPFAHLEEGTVWRPLDDADNWYADAEMVIPEDDVDDGDSEDAEEDIWNKGFGEEDNEVMEAGTLAKAKPARVRAARSDASVGSIARSIERIFALPAGSVALCGPDKRALRRDARIATLRRRWET